MRELLAVGYKKMRELLTVGYKKMRELLAVSYKKMRELWHTETGAPAGAARFSLIGFVFLHIPKLFYNFPPIIGEIC